MKNTQNKLMMIFSALIAVCVVIVVFFENELLPCGIMHEQDKSLEFVLATAMELWTICSIPLTLKLFHFKRIKQRIDTPQKLLHWGLLRLMMLGLPMIINTLLYYVFMNVAFGYLAIIIFLCLFFIVPTKERCESEINTTTKS